MARRHRQTILDAQAAKPVDSKINGHTTKRTETMVSESLGCNPSQAREFHEDARKAGFTAVSFDKNGDCHLPSFGSERERYMKFRGVYQE